MYNNYMYMCVCITHYKIEAVVQFANFCKFLEQSIQTESAV